MDSKTSQISKNYINYWYYINSNIKHLFANSNRINDIPDIEHLVALT